MVYFGDDRLSYTFEVVSASYSKMVVSDGHLRTSSANLSILQNIDGITGGSDLELLGAHFTIGDLENGSQYFVRVSASNSALGTGEPVMTKPMSASPESIPKPPVPNPRLRVVDKSTLQVDLSRINSRGIHLHSFIVDVFYTRSSYGHLKTNVQSS